MFIIHSYWEISWLMFRNMRCIKKIRKPECKLVIFRINKMLSFTLDRLIHFLFFCWGRACIPGARFVYILYARLQFWLCPIWVSSLLFFVAFLKMPLFSFLAFLCLGGINTSGEICGTGFFSYKRGNTATIVLKF